MLHNNQSIDKSSNKGALVPKDKWFRRYRWKEVLFPQERKFRWRNDHIHNGFRYYVTEKTGIISIHYTTTLELRIIIYIMENHENKNFRDYQVPNKKLNCFTAQSNIMTKSSEKISLLTIWTFTVNVFWKCKGNCDTIHSKIKSQPANTWNKIQVSH